jgi:hypothetical protein
MLNRNAVAQKRTLPPTPVSVEPPSIPVWGNALWRFLHGMCERTGREIKKTKGVVDEEKRVWNILLQAIGVGLPCPQCRLHYKEYMMRNSYMHCITLTGESRKEALRKWLWELHENVNLQTNKQPPSIVRLEDIPQMYGGYDNIRALDDFNIINDQTRKGMFVRMLVRENRIKLIHAMNEMMMILG